MKFVYLPIITTLLTFSQPSPTYTIYLYGDSISRGYGLGQFEHPSPINSIWGIANLLLIENGHPEIKVVWRGYQDPQRFWLDRYENIVNGSDVFIFQNAGPHFSSEPYRNWLRLWKLSAGNSKLYLTTTPDDKPIGNINDYSAINPIVREEATGIYELLDWDAEFTDKAEVIDLIRADGVHFNAFGNFLAAVSILKAQGIEVENYDSVITAFDGYYESVDVPTVLGELAE